MLRQVKIFSDIPAYRQAGLPVLFHTRTGDAAKKKVENFA
jgi:hypothetical protein